jgi:hypothetical protein
LRFMKLFQKLIAAPAIISMASGFAVNAAEINQPEFSPFTKSPEVISTGDFKSELLVPGDWAYDSLKDLSKSPRFNGGPVHRIEAAAELNRLIAGGEGLMNGAQIDRLSDELGSELAIMKGRVDGLEARVNTIEAGSFSETTSMSGVVDVLLGGANNGDSTEQNTMFNYHWSVDLNTSFTGEDKLNVEISAGNQTGTKSVNKVLDFSEPTSDELRIEDVNYTFPVGEWTISVGESMDASKQYPGACSVDNMVAALDDCGSGNSTVLGGDVAVSAGREFGDGWAIGLGISADDGETTSGIFTSEGTDKFGGAIGYENDSYALTLAAADVDSGFYYGVNGTYSPDGFPTISGGVEFGNPDFSTEDTTQYVVGLSSDLGEGSLAAAYGTKSAYKPSETNLYAYDVSYSYPLNDSMSIKPFAYVVEQTGDDDSGIGVITTFKF